MTYYLCGLAYKKLYSNSIPFLDWRTHFDLCWFLSLLLLLGLVLCLCAADFTNCCQVSCGYDWQEPRSVWSMSRIIHTSSLISNATWWGARILRSFGAFLLHLNLCPLMINHVGSNARRCCGEQFWGKNFMVHFGYVFSSSPKSSYSCSWIVVMAVVEHSLLPQQV